MSRTVDKAREALDSAVIDGVLTPERWDAYARRRDAFEAAVRAGTLDEPLTYQEFRRAVRRATLEREPSAFAPDYDRQPSDTNQVRTTP